MDLFEIEDFQIEENLDDYAHSLEEDDIDWIVREVNYFKTFYGLELKSDQTIKNLNEAAKIEVPKRHIQGVHTYDIMRNPYYRREFHYIPV